MIQVPVGKTKIIITEDAKSNLGLDIENLKKGDIGYIDGYIERWMVIVKIEDGSMVLINNVKYLKAIK